MFCYLLDIQNEDDLKSKLNIRAGQATALWKQILLKRNSKKFENFRFTL